MQGAQVITALSEGRAYGDAGGEGLFSSYRISESLTHPACGIPPHLQAGEGCCQLTFRVRPKCTNSAAGLKSVWKLRFGQSVRNTFLGETKPISCWKYEVPSR